MDVNEENTIIEDSITRQREFQKYHKERYEDMVKAKAPKELIDYFKKVSEMTIGEYELMIKEEEKKEKEKISEYAKNNPIQESVVNLIYKKVDEMEYKESSYCYQMYFSMHLNPISFLKKEDWDHKLYDAFLDHGYELYKEKYKSQGQEAEKTMTGIVFQ